MPEEAKKTEATIWEKIAGGVTWAVPIILSAVYFTCQSSPSFYLWLVSWMINFSMSCISVDGTANILSWFSFSKTLSDMLDTHKNDRAVYEKLSRLIVILPTTGESGAQLFLGLIDHGAIKKLIEGITIYLNHNVPGTVTMFSPMTHAIALLSEGNLSVADTPALKDCVLQMLKKFPPNDFLSAGIMGHVSATLSNIFSSEFLYDILSVDFLSCVGQFFAQLGKHRNILAAAQVLHLLSLLLTAQITAKNHGRLPVPQLDLTVAANSPLVNFVNSIQAYDGVLPTHMRKDIGQICSGLRIICSGRDFAAEDGVANNKYRGTPTPTPTSIVDEAHHAAIPMKQPKDDRDSSARQRRLLQDKEKEIADKEKEIASLQAKIEKLMHQKSTSDEERDASVEYMAAIKQEIQELRKTLQTYSAPIQSTLETPARRDDLSAEDANDSVLGSSNTEVRRSYYYWIGKGLSLVVGGSFSLLNLIFAYSIWLKVKIPLVAALICCWWWDDVGTILAIWTGWWFCGFLYRRGFDEAVQNGGLVAAIICLAALRPFVSYGWYVYFIAFPSSIAAPLLLAYAEIQNDGLDRFVRDRIFGLVFFIGVCVLLLLSHYLLEQNI